MFHPRLYKTHPPTGRCSAGSAPRKRPFPAFSGTYPYLLCLLYYSGICRHFQVTMKFISGCFYTRLWPQSTFLLSAPGAATMTFSGVVSRNTSPTTSLPSAVTSLNATGTTLGAPLAQVASVCPVCQEALSDEESAEAPPAAEEARRFRGSVPTVGRGSGWEPADTTVSAEEHAPKITTQMGGDLCDYPQVLLFAPSHIARKGECEGETFAGFPTRVQSSARRRPILRSKIAAPKKNDHPLGGRFFWSGRRGSNSLPGIPRMAVAIRRSPASPLDLTRFAQVEAASSPVLRHIPKRKHHPDGWCFFLERATRLELATSTLARSRSTR